jgi:hypothetical protein
MSVSPQYRTDTTSGLHGRTCAAAAAGVSLPRLYLLRLGYLLVAVGFALTKWPLPINHDRPGWVSSSSPLWLAHQLDPATVKVFHSCLVS